MKKLIVELCNGFTICRTGKCILEIESCDDDFRIFKIDGTDLKVTRKEIKKVKIGSE